VQLDGDDPAYFEEQRGACGSVGIGRELLDPAAATDVAPGLSAAIERVIRVPDGVIYPWRILAANAADAEFHGATVHPNVPVESMTISDRRIVGASLGGAVDWTVQPEYVVNAAGRWAGNAVSMAGVAVTMVPSRGVMVSVKYDRLGPVLNRCRDPADGNIVMPHEEEAVLGTKRASLRP